MTKPGQNAGKGRRTGRGGRRTLRRLAVPLLLAAFACVFLYWQQNDIVTEEFSVSGAPAGFAGFRVAHISDLHAKEFGAGNRVLLEKTRALSPDIIVITGDILHEYTQFAMIPAVAAGLSDIAPTYYVTGNHEWAVGHVPELKALLTENGVRVLSNEYEMLSRGGDVLALLGADDANGFADQKTVPELAAEVREKEGTDTYLLLLSHRNNRAGIYEAARVDLTLCGHAHGGIVRFPGTDGLVGPSREWLPTHTAGLYELNALSPLGNPCQIAVSRGLGGQFPLLRVGNRPDLPLIILNPAA
jgi:predicted MPP superfamily phosphohydrolase